MPELIRGKKALLDAVTGTGAGDTFVIKHKVRSFQASLSAAGGTATVELQVSADGVIWITWYTFTLSGVSDSFSVSMDDAHNYIRGNVTAISSAVVTLTVNIVNEV